MSQTPDRSSTDGLPVVHACIVHHRGRDMLDACLRTLLASEGVDLRVVVLSNACQEPLPAIAQDSPRVDVSHTPVSIGFSEANNAAVAWAREHLGRAEYYYFLNNDTESRPDTLVALVRALRRHPHAAVAGPLTLIRDAPDHLNSLGLQLTEDAWAWDEGIGQRLDEYGALPGLREVAAVTGSALLVDAPSFEQVGGWTEIYDWYFEDIDLCLKLHDAGRATIHVPGSVIYHRVSATMTTGAERKFYFFWRNRLLLAWIHWPPSLLPRVLRWALVDEIWRRPRSENELQRRAFVGALRKLPKALRLRFRHRGPRRWRRFLHPRGSVPVITLPATTDADSPPPPDAEPTGPEPDPSVLDTASPEARPEFLLPADAWRAAPARERSDEAPSTARRVLVLGWGPLPFEDALMHYAPGTRTWQLALPLARAGHQVCVAAAHIPGSVEHASPHFSSLEREGVRIFLLDRQSFEAPGNLEALVERFRPDVLVGAAPVPSLRATELAKGGDVDLERDDLERDDLERQAGPLAALPVWVDLFGDPMAEGQAKAAVESGRSGADSTDEARESSADPLRAYWQMMARLLGYGSHFGAVSHRQRLAVIGQLGMAERLDGEAAGRELVSVLPCAAPPFELAPREPSTGKTSPGKTSTGKTSPGKTSTAQRLPGEPAPAESRSLPVDGSDLPPGVAAEVRLLWSGGFNTWCDVETLVDGLELAFDADPRLCLDVTGGAIGGHDDLTYRRFEARVEASSHGARFRLHGHLPKEQADAIRDRAHLGIVTERRLYERELGSSARLVSWLAQGLPFVCTDQSELAAEAARRGAALVYPVGDAAALAGAIATALADAETLSGMAEAALALAREQLSFEATTGPLLSWVAGLPCRATADAEAGRLGPDEGRRRASEPLLVALDRLQVETVPGLRAELESRDQKLGETRHELEQVRTQLGTSIDEYHGVRTELGEIHQSRMWKIWMGYLGLRATLGRWLRLGR